MQNQQTVKPVRCRQHQWEPLFHVPPADACKEVQIFWGGMYARNIGSHLVCTECGKLGSTRNRFSRGGRHATKPYYSQDDAPELKREAAMWNAAIDPNRVGPAAYPMHRQQQIHFELHSCARRVHTAWVGDCGVIGFFMAAHDTPAEAFPGHVAMSVRDYGSKQDWSLYIVCESEEAARFWRDRSPEGPLSKADSEAFHEFHAFGGRDGYEVACMQGKARTQRDIIRAAYAAFMETQQETSVTES